MFGYFAAKRAAEKVIAESGLPWTTLRATQFHDLILTVARGLAQLPVLPVPAGARHQPVVGERTWEDFLADRVRQPARQ
jgi:uncharacterized protein YbjT (DUF2867 family)